MVDIGDSLVAKRHTYGEDCMNCRLVSGFGIIGMGIYVFTAAKRQKVNLNRNFIYAFSFGIMGIGAARLFALPPFQRTTTQ